MITWTKYHDQHWKVTYKNKSFWIENNEKLFVYCMAFGIEMNEIERALLEIEQNDHNYAEFGGFKKSFIFSDKRLPVWLNN